VSVSKAIQAQQNRWLSNPVVSRSLERLKFVDRPHLVAKKKTPPHFVCKTVSTTETPPANPCDHDKSRELPNRVLAPGIHPKTQDFGNSSQHAPYDGTQGLRGSKPVRDNAKDRTPSALRSVLVYRDENRAGTIKVSGHMEAESGPAPEQEYKDKPVRFVFFETCSPQSEPPYGIHIGQTFSPFFDHLSQPPDQTHISPRVPPSDPEKYQKELSQPLIHEPQEEG
jgi:hypothetical protein